MEALNYFGIDDYTDLEAKDRVVVDQWLTENNVLGMITLIQETGDGRLVLSGPDVSEDGLANENELEVVKILEKNTFPWEILQKVST